MPTHLNVLIIEEEQRLAEASSRQARNQVEIRTRSIQGPRKFNRFLCIACTVRLFCGEYETVRERERLVEGSAGSRLQAELPANDLRRMTKALLRTPD